MDYKDLAKAAVNAKKRAKPTFSNFHVGAALLTNDGKVYQAGNIESSSYSLTMCAERTSIFKAISEGEEKFTAIAIAGDAPDYTAPCGACRQVINDLCGDIDIVMVKNNGDYKVLKSSELLPHAFSSMDLT